MGIFAALLALIRGIHRSQRPLMRSFDVSFDLRFNKRRVNNWDANNLRCHRAHYDVTIMDSFAHTLHLYICYLYCVCFILKQGQAVLLHSKPHFTSLSPQKGMLLHHREIFRSISSSTPRKGSYTGTVRYTTNRLVHLDPWLNAKNMLYIPTTLNRRHLETAITVVIASSVAQCRCRSRDLVKCLIARSCLGIMTLGSVFILCYQNSNAC